VYWQVSEFQGLPNDKVDALLKEEGFPKHYIYTGAGDDLNKPTTTGA